MSGKKMPRLPIVRATNTREWPSPGQPGTIGNACCSMAAARITRSFEAVQHAPATPLLPSLTHHLFHESRNSGRRDLVRSTPDRDRSINPRPDVGRSVAVPRARATSCRFFATLALAFRDSRDRWKREPRRTGARAR